MSQSLKVYLGGPWENRQGVRKAAEHAVETGVAIVSLKGIILVGEPTNIFHHLKLIRVGTVAEALVAAKKLKPLEYVLERVIVRSVEAKYD